MYIIYFKYVYCIFYVVIIATTVIIKNNNELIWYILDLYYIYNILYTLW